MKVCVRNRRLGAAVAVISLFLALTCCTKVDDEVGLNLIPDNQKMSVGIDTLYSGINTYTTYTDSIKSSNLVKVYLGQTNDPLFGVTRASALMQYLPIYRSDSVSTGINYQLDSLWFLLAGSVIDSVNITKSQKFYVYDVIKPVYSDSTYYTGFPYNDYINTTPMFSFTLKGKSGGKLNDTLRLNIENKALCDAYFDKLMGVTDEELDNDSLFLSKIKGFYIAPAGESPKDAAIFQVDLDDGDSYYLLYGHNYDPQMPSVVLDTVSHYYTFYSDRSYIENTAIACVEHDYTGTPIESVVKPSYLSDLGASQPKTYVQGLAGVTTTLDFTDDLVSDLRSMIPSGKEMVIRQALLYVWLERPIMVEKYDKAPSRLGSYSKYGTLTNIVDYSYYYEANMTDYQLPYNGYLNRSNGYYPLNITSYVQRLVSDDDTNRRVILGQEAYSLYLPAQVVLNGSEAADLPPKMSITYILLDKNLK